MGSSSYSLSPAAVSVVIFLVALSATHTNAQADGIDPLLPICKTVGGGSRYFGIDFCLSALGSDSRSRTADGYSNLSIIAVDFVAANATSTVAKIGNQLKTGAGKDDDDTKESLESCQALYSGVVDLLPGCTAAIKTGKFDQAALSLENTASAARECDDAFRRSNVASPLTLEDDNEFMLAKLAVALLGFAS